MSEVTNRPPHRPRKGQIGITWRQKALFLLSFSFFVPFFCQLTEK